MIRAATIEDIPRLVELGKEFYLETFLPEIFLFDVESVVETLASFIQQPEKCVVLVSESEGIITGGICGIVVPNYWNKHIKTAQQVIWFVSRQYRNIMSLRLLSEYEKAVRKLGATVFLSGAKKNKSFDIMDAVLKRRGYRELESIHIKGGV